MKAIFVGAILAAVIALAACQLLGGTREPAPPPAFISWCDTCETYTKWGLGEDYFYCSASGTVWTPTKGVIK